MLKYRHYNEKVFPFGLAVIQKNILLGEKSSFRHYPTLKIFFQCFSTTTTIDVPIRNKSGMNSWQVSCSINWILSAAQGKKQESRQLFLALILRRKFNFLKYRGLMLYVSAYPAFADILFLKAVRAEKKLEVILMVSSLSMLTCNMNAMLSKENCRSRSLRQR